MKNLDEMFDEMIKSDTTDELLENAFNYIEALEKENSRLIEELADAQWETEEAQWKAEGGEIENERLKKELAEVKSEEEAFSLKQGSRSGGLRG